MEFWGKPIIVETLSWNLILFLNDKEAKNVPKSESLFDGNSIVVLCQAAALLVQFTGNESSLSRLKY